MSRILGNDFPKLQICHGLSLGSMNHTEPFKQFGTFLQIKWKNFALKCQRISINMVKSQSDIKRYTISILKPQEVHPVSSLRFSHPRLLW
jgi:hypothetical protein